MKGFTLIELLITMTIFSLVVTGFLGLFSSAFKYQQRNLSLAYLLNNVSYITEYMSRALRMAGKDINGTCIGSNHNFAISTVDIYGNMSIRFLNSNNEKCQEFTLENGQLRVGISKGVTPPLPGDFMVLTPSNIVVSNLKFIVIGEPQPPEDYSQPKLTFTLKLETSELLPLNLQNTISQRELDIKY